MRRQRRGFRLLALMFGFSLLAATAACGSDDDGEEAAETEGDLTGACPAPEEAAEEAPAEESTTTAAPGEAPATTAAPAPETTTTTAPPTDEESTDAVPLDQIPRGGELIDNGTLTSGPAEFIDPALNVALDNYQVVNALYDGLTEIDSSDPQNPRVAGAVAESWESNPEATVWTFHIRDGLTFSDGTPVLPSSFERAWNRASDPDLGGGYSYLFNFVEGGGARLAGEAEELTGVVADDAAMTLTTTLSAPYADWAWVAGFQIFMPMPEAVDELDDQNDWDQGLMIGNGPFMLEEPRSDQEIRLVPNPEWNGTLYDPALGLPEQPFLERLIYQVATDRDTAYNAFEAGEVQVGPIPQGRFGEAAENYGTSTDIPILGSYHFELCWTDPVIGGPENAKLRQAISLGIDREDINQTVWDGVFESSTGVTPPGIPGFEEGLCDYCAYDPEAAQAALDEWLAAGNELPSEPIQVQFNAGEYHEDVVAIMQDNLSELGIEIESTPMDTETYFSQLSEGACVYCRSGWFADYSTYDNFMYDLFHSDAIGGNNHGNYSNPEFDRLIDEAKATLDEAAQADLFHQAEQLLLNQDTGVIPVAVYHGDYVFDDETVVNFHQTPFGLIPYEVIGVRS
jgi:oligopeptide transport system substrate-binding protein